MTAAASKAYRSTAKPKGRCDGCHHKPKYASSDKKDDECAGCGSAGLYATAANIFELQIDHPRLTHSVVWRNDLVSELCDSERGSGDEPVVPQVPSHITDASCRRRAQIEARSPINFTGDMLHCSAQSES